MMSYSYQLTILKTANYFLGNFSYSLEKQQINACIIKELMREEIKPIYD